MDAHIARQKEAYKAGLNEGAAAERRAAKLREFGKEKRERTLTKRRHTTAEDAGFTLDAAAVAQAVQAASPSSDPAGRLPALRALRRYSSSADEPSLGALLSAGLAPHLGWYVLTQLGTVASPALPGTPAAGCVSDEERLEAVWCCINLAAGSHEHTMAVMAAASPGLIALLRSPSALLASHAAWALGNVAADCNEARETLAAQGAVPALAALLATRNRALALTAASALANLLKAPRVPPQAYIDAGTVPAAVHWLRAAAGGAGAEASSALAAELATECAWVLAFLSGSGEAACRAIAAAGALPLVAHALQRGSLRGVTPCLRVLANAAVGSAAAADAIISQPGLLAAVAVVASPWAGAAAATPWRIESDADHAAPGAGPPPDAVPAAGAAADGDAAAAAEFCIATLPADARFSHGHVRDALWLLSVLAGSPHPPHALALLSTALPPHVAHACASALQRQLPPAAAPAASRGSSLQALLPVQASLGFLPLLAAHAAGPWQVRQAASWGLLNLANARFALPSEQAAALPGGNSRVPLLGPVLSFHPLVLRLFLEQLPAPDLDAVRVGLAFTDLVLYNWRRPRGVPFADHGAPAADAAAAGAAAAAPPVLALPPAVLALGPHCAAPAAAAMLSGAALVEEAEGVGALETARDALAAACGAGDGGAAAAGLRAWAADLLETFYGEDSDFLDEEAGGLAAGAGDAAPPPHAAPHTTTATTEQGHFRFG